MIRFLVLVATYPGAGINVQPAEAIPPGAFDRRGEFKDFAWPTSGVSPVNRSQK